MERYSVRIVAQGADKLFYTITQALLEILFGRRKNFTSQILHIWKSKGLYRYTPFAKKYYANLALFPYRDPYIKASIQALKFHNHTHYTDTYGSLLSEALIETLNEIGLLYNFQDPILCIVPSHNRTIRTRGYCVPDLVARSALDSGLSEWLEYRPHLLRKTRHTIRQAQISHRSKRLENPKGCFTLAKTPTIEGRNIIVLDDVYTTGATMKECTSVLRTHKAKRVLQVSLAR